jgi:hypothetical protein
MADRQMERDSVEYIACEIPQGMTLREWRCEQPVERPGRLRAAAAAVGRATRRRRRP